MNATEAVPRPLPQLTGHTGTFFEYMSRHELRFQRCEGCARWRHFPQELCPSCKSPRFEWALSKRLGTVYSWTTTHRALHPAFQETPFTKVLVELDEGPRVYAVLVDSDRADLDLDARIEILFTDVTDAVTLPAARLVHQ